MNRFQPLLVLAFLLGSLTFKAQITVNANVDHTNPDNTDSLGNIRLSVSGGNGTYSYLWKWNSTVVTNSADISQVKRTTYSLSVSSSGHATVNYIYKLGYKVLWGAHYGTSEQNDTLKNTMALCPLGTALSKNTLLPGENGWMEVVLSAGSATQQIGFLDSAFSIPNICNDIDFGVLIEPTRLRRVSFNLYSSASPTVSYKTGDVLRLERVGTTLNYLLNGITIWTVSNPNAAGQAWKIRAAVDYRNPPFKNVGCSFRFPPSVHFGDYMKLSAVIKHSRNSGSPDGSIRVSANDQWPIQVTWSNGAAPMEVLTSGNYTTRITDNFGHYSDFVYSIGYKATWKDFYGTWERNDSLTNNGTVAWGSAISKNVLKGNTDGWVEAVLHGSGSEQIGFLDSSYSSGSQIDMDLGYYKASTFLQRIVNGVYTNVGYWREGDVVRLERSGSTFKFKLNGNTLWSTTNATLAARDLRVKGAAYLVGGPIVNIGCSFSKPLEVGIERVHVEESHAMGGTAILNVTGGTPPYRVKWPDGVISNSRTDLVPGNYRVRISDLNNDSLICYPRIGYRPNWQFKTNMSFSPDTAGKIRVDSLGLAIAVNRVNQAGSGWTEFKMNSLSDDILIGLIGDPNDVAVQTGTYGSTFYKNNSQSVYQLMRKAIDNTLSYPSGTLDPGSGYDRVYCVRASKGLLTVLMKGAAQGHGYFYNAGDVVKVGRTVTGQITLAVNEVTVYTHPVSVLSEFLYPTLAVNSPYNKAGAGLTGTGNGGTDPNPTPQVITYAKPGLKPDGGFYTDVAGNLYFLLEGEYNTSNLSYKIYDKTANVVLSQNNTNLINSSIRYLGDNRYTLNVSSLANGFYLLEAANEKNEKVYLRFRRQVNSGGSGTYSSN